MTHALFLQFSSTDGPTPALRGAAADTSKGLACFVHCAANSVLSAGLAALKDLRYGEIVS